MTIPSMTSLRQTKVVRPNPRISLNLPGELSLPLASLDPRLTFSSRKRPGDTLESGPKMGRKKEGGMPREGGNADASKKLTQAREPRSAANIEDYGFLSRLKITFAWPSRLKIFKTRWTYVW